MAKRKKQSPLQAEYAKELRRIRQFINRAEKRGYIFPETIIPNRPKKITNQSINRLRKLNAEALYRKSQYIDTETGELRRGEVGREIERSKSAKRAARTRKLKKQAERDFWQYGITGERSDEQYYEAPTEDDLNRVRANNFLEQFLSRLGEPVTTYININGYTRRRKAEVAALAEEGRQKVYAIVMNRIYEVGKPAFGRLINPHATRLNTLLDILMYDSSGGVISSAITELIQIVSGEILSDEVLRGAGAYEEWEESWDEY